MKSQNLIFWGVMILIIAQILLNYDNIDQITVLLGIMAVGTANLILNMAYIYNLGQLKQNGRLIDQAKALFS